MSWEVDRFVGSAREFHARPLPHDAGRAAWICHVDRPALVLGSTQRDSVVDRAACDAAGVEVVRRRSGGGIVLVRPTEMVWVDVVLPAGDDLWEDDVGRAMWWVGETWQRALETGGVTGTTVHRARPVDSAWSRLVCFAGTGPGEVLHGERKVVGISQRRTRGSARFQCGVHLHWDADALRALLAEPRPAPGELDDAVAAVPLGAADLVAAFLAHLPH